MPLRMLVCLLMLCVACKVAEAPPASNASESSAAVTDLEAEGEVRAEAVADHLVGQPGPAVALTTIEGTKIELAELYGKKPVYLKFWATWCAPCRKQMPEFERIYETLGDDLEVIAVNTGFADDKKAVREYLQEIDLKMPIVIDDGQLADLLELRVTPQHVLIGLDGRISYISHLDGEPLNEALRNVLAANPRGNSVAAPRAPEPENVVQLGDLVVDLFAVTIDGETVSLGTAGPLGVLFFSPWCESYLADSRPTVSQACRQAREQVEELAGKDERKLIAVSDRLWASEADLEQYRTDTQTKVPLALDSTGQLFRSFGVRQIPSIATIDGDGRLVQVAGSEDRDSAGNFETER